jgi:hypothetical protein
MFTRIKGLRKSSAKAPKAPNQFAAETARRKRNPGDYLQSMQVNYLKTAAGATKSLNIGIN